MTNNQEWTTEICAHCDKPMDVDWIYSSSTGVYGIALPFFRNVVVNRCRAVLPADSDDWLYYHDECFVVATPPEHRIRGGYR